MTVQLEPRADGPAGSHIATTAIENADDRSVIVVDNQGRTDVSCRGGNMSQTAREPGIAGTVINGTCRDGADAALRSCDDAQAGPGGMSYPGKPPDHVCTTTTKFATVASDLNERPVTAPTGGRIR